MKKLIKLLTIICLTCLACASLISCGESNGKNLGTIEVPFNGEYNISILFEDGDNIGNAKLYYGDEQVAIKDSNVFFDQQGDYKLVIASGYYTLVSKDITAPKVSVKAIGSYCVGESMQFEVKTNDTTATVSTQLFYNNENVELSNNTFTPNKSGEYLLKVSVADSNNNFETYDFTYKIGIKTEFVVSDGETVTVTDSLYKEMVDNANEYNFAYVIANDSLTGEKVITGDSFTVRDSDIYKVKVTATKIGSEETAVKEYVFHTDNTQLVSFIGETSNVECIYHDNRTSKGELTYKIKENASGYNTFNVNYTSTATDGRCYVMMRGLPENTHYDYLIYDINATNLKGSAGLTLSVYPTENISSGKHCAVIQGNDEIRVMIKNATTDENGILPLYFYLHNDVNFDVKNVKLFKTFNPVFGGTLNNYNVELDSNGAIIECNVENEKLLSNWVQEGNRASLIIKDLTPNTEYDMAVDISTSKELSGDQSTYVYFAFYHDKNSKGNDHYGILTNTCNRKTFVINKKTTNDKGELIFDGLYIAKDQVLTFENLVVGKSKQVVSYGDLNVEYSNALPTNDKFMNSVSVNNKLITKTFSDIGNGRNIGKGPQLIISNLTPNTLYHVSVNITTSNGILATYTNYIDESNKGTKIRDISNKTDTVVYEMLADADGVIVLNGWYGTSGVEIVWNNVTATKCVATYTSTSVPTGYSVQFAKNEGKSYYTSSVNADGKLVVKANGAEFCDYAKTPVLLIGGLKANTEYQIELNYSVIGSERCWIEMWPSNQARIDNKNAKWSVLFDPAIDVESKKLGAKGLILTSDANGEIRYGCVYLSPNVEVTFDTVKVIEKVS